MRIGVNTGGPMIAGIIENKKSVFDIFGSSMEIASDLEKHYTPNSELISREV
jgi:class 3 adenylate cyclase